MSNELVRVETTETPEPTIEVVDEGPWDKKRVFEYYETAMNFDPFGTSAFLGEITGRNEEDLDS